MRKMNVPEYTDCPEALQGNDWTLFYCLECCSSQWVYRKHAGNRYRHKLLWLRGCPACSIEFGGLYFSDLLSLVNGPVLLSRMVVSEFAC